MYSPDLRSEISQCPIPLAWVLKLWTLPRSSTLLLTISLLVIILFCFKQVRNFGFVRIGNHNPSPVFLLLVKWQDSEKYESSMRVFQRVTGIKCPALRSCCLVPGTNAALHLSWQQWEQTRGGRENHQHTWLAGCETQEWPLLGALSSAWVAGVLPLDGCPPR